MGDLCLSSRALRTLGLSSALIWSEMIIVSTTRWAMPGREFCSRSRRTAPVGQQRRKGRTSVTLGQRTTSLFYFVTFLSFEMCASLSLSFISVHHKSPRKQQVGGVYRA